jgi:tRNA A-37 threonylcarbamoyl transferase component Bud32
MDKIIKDKGITEENWKNALASKERIIKLISSNGELFWLKKSAPARGIFRYHVLNLFSKILRTPLLKAVPQHGGKLALKTELLRINTLKKNGVLVPEICAHSEDWILLKNLGSSIIDDMKENRKDQVRMRTLFSACLKSIKKLHLSNQYMSQGFVRNLLMVDESKGQIGFIDFEDDPISVMTLEQAQARDLLLFINSTARFFVNDSDYFNQQIHIFLEGHSNEVINSIKNTNDKLLWITKLPLQKYLGHDYQKLKIGIQALSNI